MANTGEEKKKVKKLTEEKSEKKEKKTGKPKKAERQESKEKKGEHAVVEAAEEKAGGNIKPSTLAALQTQQEVESHPEKRERYFEAVGRRKTSIARVRLFTRTGDFLVNEKPYGVYFPTLELQKIAEDSLQKMKLFGRFKVTVKVQGGGIHSQAEAVRHGLARCLTKFNADFRKRLKRAGFLKRDPRMKERKKPGLKRARRAPQWQKR